MSGADVLQATALKRIADALETLVGSQISKDLDADASTLYQLAGSAAGFADELDSILMDSDQFKRAQRLRDLQKKARRIANMYAEQADKARTKADSEVDSEDAADART